MIQSNYQQLAVSRCSRWDGKRDKISSEFCSCEVVYLFFTKVFCNTVLGWRSQDKTSLAETFRTTSPGASEVFVAPPMVFSLLSFAGYRLLPKWATASIALR